MPLNCTTEAGCLCAAVSGEIDHHAAKDLMQKLMLEIERQMPSALILDCAQVSFMDSSGIALVLRAKQQMDSYGGQLQLRSVPQQAAKVLKAANVQRIIPFD